MTEESLTSRHRLHRRLGDRHVGNVKLVLGLAALSSGQRREQNLDRKTAKDRMAAPSTSNGPRVSPFKNGGADAHAGSLNLCSESCSTRAEDAEITMFHRTSTWTVRHGTTGRTYRAPRNPSEKYDPDSANGAESAQNPQVSVRFIFRNATIDYARMRYCGGPALVWIQKPGS